MTEGVGSVWLNFQKTNRGSSCSLQLQNGGCLEDETVLLLGVYA